MALKKDIIRKVMYNYLTDVGYPDISNYEILKEHTIPMFEILVGANLVHPLHFKAYIKAAVQQYNIAAARGRK